MHCIEPATTFAVQNGVSTLDTVVLENVLVHLEPCLLHGIAIIKDRFCGHQTINRASISLSRWLRTSSKHDDLFRALNSQMRVHLEIVNAERHEGAEDAAFQIIRHIYVHSAESFLWVYSKRQRKMIKSPLAQQLGQICHMVDFVSKPGSLLFYNKVGGRSREHLELGMPVGSHVFASADVAADQVATCILEFLSGRRWERAIEGRWTHLCSVQRKFLICCLLGNILPRALRDVQIQ